MKHRNHTAEALQRLREETLRIYASREEEWPEGNYVWGLKYNYTIGNEGFIRFPQRSHQGNGRIYRAKKWLKKLIPRSNNE